MPIKRKLGKNDTRARRTARYLLAGGAAIGLVVTASFWLRLSFWFELPSTYSPQAAIVLIAILMMFAATVFYEWMNQGWRRVLAASIRSWTMLGLVLVFLAHMVFVPLISPVRASFDEDAVGDDVRVMTFNKLYDNQEYSLIANYIETRKPDILAIEEIFYDEAELLAERMGYEQWHMAECGCSAYGSDLALFSRFPLENVDLAFEDRLGGVLRGEVELSVDKTVSVYAAHIVVPYSSLAYEIRQDMLSNLATQINGETNDVILMGDFNASPYSYDMRRLSSDLPNSTLVADKPWARCTWFGFTELLCASIDHVYVPSSAVVINKQIGPAIGSDHRAVDVDVILN